MTIRATHTIYCDSPTHDHGCTVYPAQGPTRTAAWQEAKAQGWTSHREGKGPVAHYCPQCSPTPPPVPTTHCPRPWSHLEPAVRS